MDHFPGAGRRAQRAGGAAASSAASVSGAAARSGSGSRPATRARMRDLYCACVSGTASLRRLLFGPGQPTEQPDRDADHHDEKDGLGDQEEDACRDPKEREKDNRQNLPQEESDHTGGGDAENGLQDSPAPLEAPTLRQFIAGGVNPDPGVTLRPAQAAATSPVGPTAPSARPPSPLQGGQ